MPKQQHRGFRGANGLGYMGPVAANWVPMGNRVPALPLNGGIAHQGAHRPKMALLGPIGHH